MKNTINYSSSKVNPPLYAHSLRAKLDQIFQEAKNQAPMRLSAADRRAQSESSSEKRGDSKRLGNNAKFQASKENQGLTSGGNFRELTKKDGILTAVDHDTGEIKHFDQSGKKTKIVRDSDQARHERFRLQAQAAKLLPNTRTSKCLKLFQKGADEVKVLKSTEFGTCQFAGLQTCGSVWACPVCAAKVSARRGAELVQAMRQHADNGGKLIMVTYTVPHGIEDNLKQMLGALSKAQASMKAHRTFKNSIKYLRRLGTVKALEVTNGVNGWHPHIHEVWFIDPVLYEYDLPAKLEQLKNDIYGVWRWAALEAGFEAPSIEHGVDVTLIDDLEKAAEYMAKEMTMAHSKIGKGTNFTPFDLLRLSVDDAHYGALFVEYAHAFKGSQQLRWSNGLKAIFQIEDKTDEELSEERIEDAQEVGVITKEDWQMLLKVERKYPHLSPRAAVLTVAAGPWQNVQVFISSCRLLL